MGDDLWGKLSEKDKLNSISYLAIVTLTGNNYRG